MYLTTQIIVYFLKMFKRTIALVLISCICQVLTAQPLKKEKRKGNTTETTEFKVNIGLDYAPTVLNPLSFVDNNGEVLLRQVFQSLTALHPVTLEPIPVLAQNLPLVFKNDAGEVCLQYKIRPEATWNSGRAIVARDVEFTLKALRCPRVDQEGTRAKNFKQVRAVEMYTNDPRKITLILHKNHDLEIYDYIHDLFILDPYVFDPNNYLRKFSLEKIDELVEQNKDKFFTERDLNRFAMDYNSKSYAFKELSGSGAYSFKVTNEGVEDIVLLRKDKWWGDLLAGVNPYFSANPTCINFRIMADDSNDAIKLFASEAIDIVSIGDKATYEALLKNSTKNYQFFQVPMLTYEYIGLNMNNKILADVNIRQALSFLIDYDAIITDVYQGLAKTICSPVPQALSYYCNQTLVKEKLDLLKVRNLINQGGWKDSDGDGLLEKIIDGKKIACRLNLIFSHNFPHREKIAKHLQQNAKALGIEIDVQGFDQSLLGVRLKNRAFDMYVGGWSNGPTLNNPATIWSTKAIGPDGYNYSGFGSSKTDELIVKINNVSIEERATLMKELQTEIYNQKPFIFIAAPEQRLVVRNKFNNLKTTALRPGIFLGSLEAKTSN